MARRIRIIECDAAHHDEVRRLLSDHGYEVEFVMETSPAGDGPIVVEVDPDLGPLIPGYLDSRRRDSEAIEEALTSGDLPPVESLGHRMKGSGGGYGLDRISEIGAALERAAKRGDAEAARQQLGELRTFLDRVQVVAGSPAG